MKLRFTHSFWFMLLLAVVLPASKLTAQNSYFFPGKKMNPAIKTPEQFFGFAMGSHQARYDMIINYMTYLTTATQRAKIQTIGYTNEMRPQIYVAFSSKSNLSKLENIQRDHLVLADPTKPMPDVTNMPVVVQLGANVHGNETSGGEAMILAAYYLTACDDADLKKIMDESIILIEPVLNPDGRDRFVNWVNMHRAEPPTADPADREHNEVWPGGRMNHYWFDLNRDWYLNVQTESQNRLKMYHSWYPNVVTDHHEMGTNSTFFFEPSKENAENPLVPAYVYKTLNTKFAKYYEAAMNDIGALYYTKESFDNLYPGYGSSYPDMQGGLGLLFEQGSARGHVQESQNGLITFAFTIKNQLVNALATLKASQENRVDLLKFQREFFASAVNDALKNPVKAYVIGDASDATRVREFTRLMLQHKIECYELENTVTTDGLTFEKNKAIIIPTSQPQYRLVQSVFERPTKFADSIFYDASAWNLALSFGLPHAELKTAYTKGTLVKMETLDNKATPPQKSNYAYVLNYADYNATKALYQLQKAGVAVKVSSKSFKINDRQFGHGTLVIPLQTQTISADSVFAAVKKIGQDANVNFVSIGTGFAQNGIDLGSNFISKTTKPEALLVVGQGVSAYEAGEVWHLLDTKVGMPISKVELSSLARLNLNRYNTLIMVSGQYPNDAALVGKIKNWVANGGTLITLKTASEWAIKNGFSKEKLRTNTKADSLTMRKTRFNFEDATAVEGAKNTSGSIYEADLDTTHPIGYGYSNRKISVYRNNNTFLEPSNVGSNTVVQYADKPLLNGYVHPQSLKKISGSAGILVNGEGNGRVILFADNPNFRGIWYGTNKLFLNAIFFGQNINISNAGGE